MLEHLIQPEPAPKPPEPKPSEQIQGMDSVAKQNEIHVGNRECKNCQTVEKAPKPEPPKRKLVCVILEHLIRETIEMDFVPKQNGTQVGNRVCENCQTIEKAQKSEPRKPKPPEPPKRKQPETMPGQGGPSKVCAVLEHLTAETKEMDAVPKQNVTQVGNRECETCQTIEKAPKPKPPKQKRPQTILGRGGPSKVCAVLEHLTAETKEMDAVPKQNDTQFGNRECETCQTIEKAPKPKPPKQKQPQTILGRGGPSKVCAVLEHLTAETKEMDAVPKQNDTQFGNRECENSKTNGVGCRSILQSLLTFFMSLQGFRSTAYLRPGKEKKERKVSCQSIKEKLC